MARHFGELIVWQLADAIRVQVPRLTARPGFSRDLKLQAQTEDAINSVCRNIAEGFGCDSHREFVRFLVITRRSLNEVQDALRGAQLKGHVSTSDLVTIRALLNRLYPALSRFIASLRDNGR